MLRLLATGAGEGQHRMMAIWMALAAVLFGASGAVAAAFGPATASLGSFDVPTVVLGSGSGTIRINGGVARLGAGSGSLAGTPYSGSGDGLLHFSFTPNVVVANPVSALFSFADQVGGSFVFDLQSVDTVTYSNSPGVSTSIALYLLGTIGDATLDLTPSPTSLTMTFNSTGSSGFSESGSLANPPAPTGVPEPASLALLGIGLVAAGAYRRRKRTGGAGVPGTRLDRGDEGGGG